MLSRYYLATDPTYLWHLSIKVIFDVVIRTTQKLRLYIYFRIPIHLYNFILKILVFASVPREIAQAAEIAPAKRVT